MAKTKKSNKKSKTVKEQVKLSPFEKFQQEKRALRSKAKGNEVVNQDGVVTIKAQESERESEDQFPRQSISIESGVIIVQPPKETGPVNKVPAKRVLTYDLNKKENGFLIELGKQDRFTTSYLSAALPGAFKGFHLHKVREANYVCVKGKIKVILYTPNGREEHILSADRPERLHIPINTPTGLSNEWGEEAWIVNSPVPPFDPELKGEQVDYTEEQCERKEYLKK